MPQQTPKRVTARTMDLRGPQSDVRFGTWYLVDEGLPTERFVTGYDLVAMKSPAKISAIAWRV